MREYVNTLYNVAVRYTDLPVNAKDEGDVADDDELSVAETPGLTVDPFSIVWFVKDLDRNIAYSGPIDYKILRERTSGPTKATKSKSFISNPFIIIAI